MYYNNYMILPEACLACSILSSDILQLALIIIPGKIHVRR